MKKKKCDSSETFIPNLIFILAGSSYCSLIQTD